MVGPQVSTPAMAFGVTENVRISTRSEKTGDFYKLTLEVSGQKFPILMSGGDFETLKNLWFKTKAK